METSTALSTLISQYQTLANGVLNLDLHIDALLTHHSTAIEGSTLTLAETEILFKKGLASVWKII